MKTQSTNEPTRKTKPRRGPSHPEGVLSAAFASSVRARGSGLTRVGILALLAGVLSSQAQVVFSPPPTPVLLDGNSAEFPTTSETTVTDSAGGTHTIKALADSNYLYLAFVVNDNSSPCESTARDRVVIQLRGQAAESQPFGSTARQISVEVERTAGAAPAFFRTVLDGDPTPNWVPSALPGSAVQSAGQLIPAGALGSGTGYQVEVKIDRNLFGIPATDAFFRIALAIIDATGTPSATPGRCLAHSAHYPAKPCLELTNDRVDRGQAKLGAYWLQPSVWGTGYFSTATAAAAKDVYLSRKNDADQEEWYYSKDIVATSCEGQGYRYHSAGPCPIQVHARLRNETGTTAARGLLFLYGAHGTSAGTWVVVEHKTRVPVPAGVNHTSDFSSAPIALAGGYGGLGTGHPCARVYVLPPDLPVFGVPGALKTNAELEAWLEANVGCLEAAHFAQKNLSAADSGTCACSGAPAAPTFSSPPGPRQLAGIDEATKDLVVRFGPEIAGLVGQGKMVAKIAVRGSTIVPDTEASPYDFVEDLGGFVDLVEVEDVRRPEGAAFEFEIANPTPFPRSVWLVPELWAPKHAGPVGLNLDLGPFRMEPGEVRTIRAALLPEARCAECCLQVFAEEKGLLTLEAEHHHRRLEGDRSRWIPRGPGNRLSGLFAMEGSPLFGNDRYAEGKAPARLDYRVRFETPGKYRVWARGYHPVSPVSERGFSLRVALLDSGPEESGAGLVRFPVAEIPFWIGEDLERGEAVVVVAKPGERILSVWLEEPATVLDKVVLSREGIAPEGDGPAESSTMPSCQPSEPPPVGPVRIRAANDGRAVVLSWDGGGVLQFAPEIPRTGSPVVWKDLGGSNSPVTLPVLDRQRFYRLRR